MIDKGHTQAKLERVILGAVWDVFVDIRKGVPTFGKYIAVTLTGENKRQFYIPRGFAHGFIVLKDRLETPGTGRFRHDGGAARKLFCRK